MIKAGRSLKWTFATLCLCLCLSLPTGHGRQNPSEHKRKDSSTDSKKQSLDELEKPEMVLLSGAQKNDLNLEPLNVAIAPNEAYQAKPGEKPIVISVSNDKQVLSEENRMLPNPILVDGSIANLEFLHKTLFSNSSAGKHTRTRLRSENATRSSQNSLPDEKLGDLGQLKRSEMKPHLAAIHKDETCSDAPKSAPETFNQTLSSEQLLCIIYKLLSMYKPNFTGLESTPSTVARAKSCTTEELTTLKPIEKVMLNLALSRASHPQPCKTPLLYHHTHPPDLPYHAPNLVQKSESLQAQKAPGIFDDIPLIRAFNRYTPTLSEDVGMNISIPGLDDTADQESDLEVPYEHHRKDSWTSGIRSHEVKSHDNKLREFPGVSQKISVQRLPIPNMFSPGSPEETLSLYSKLLEQVQDKNPSRRTSVPLPSEDLIKYFAHAKKRGSNGTSALPGLDIFSSYMKERPDNIQRNYDQLLRNKNPRERSGIKGMKRPHSISSELANQDMDPLNSFDWDPLENYNSQSTHTKGNKRKERKQSKKVQLLFKKRSKEERRKKTHDLDFLDLLSKSMVRESRNFFGKI